MQDHCIAQLSDFGDNSMLTRSVGSLNVVLFKYPNGQITALEDRCSHADVKLSKGSFTDGEIECRAHGARFDCKTGAALCMPAVAPVRSFPVLVVENEIFITVE